MLRVTNGREFLSSSMFSYAGRWTSALVFNGLLIFKGKMQLPLIIADYILASRPTNWDHEPVSE